jgi:hypothetical protein
MFKEDFSFDIIEPNNIDAQYSNEEVKVWLRRVDRRGKSIKPDYLPEIGVNKISHHNNTQNSIIVAGLGPGEKFTDPEAWELGIIDRTHKLTYYDDEPDALFILFKFQYLTNKFPGEAPNRIEGRASDSLSDSRQVRY